MGDPHLLSAAKAMFSKVETFSKSVFTGNTNVCNQGFLTNGPLLIMVIFIHPKNHHKKKSLTKICKYANEAFFVRCYLLNLTKRKGAGGGVSKTLDNVNIHALFIIAALFKSVEDVKVTE